MPATPPTPPDPVAAALAAALAGTNINTPAPACAASAPLASIARTTSQPPEDQWPPATPPELLLIIAHESRSPHYMELVCTAWRDAIASADESWWRAIALTCFPRLRSVLRSHLIDTSGGPKSYRALYHSQHRAEIPRNRQPPPPTTHCWHLTIELYDRRGVTALWSGSPDAPSLMDPRQPMKARFLTNNEEFRAQHSKGEKRSADIGGSGRGRGGREAVADERLIIAGLQPLGTLSHSGFLDLGDQRVRVLATQLPPGATVRTVSIYDAGVDEYVDDALFDAVPLFPEQGLQFPQLRAILHGPALETHGEEAHTTALYVALELSDSDGSALRYTGDGGVRAANAERWEQTMTRCFEHRLAKDWIGV